MERRFGPPRAGMSGDGARVGAVRARRIPAVRLCALLAVVGCQTGLNGRAYVREPGGGIGLPIPGVVIDFVKEDRSLRATATTDANGNYSIGLSGGRYVVLATHPDYEDYSSAPGFSVVTSGMRTMNVFLREPRVTTVFVTRHAEKQDPNSNIPSEPLSAAGAQRARELAVALYRAGITGVYSTDFVRTRETAAPLADTLMLPTTVYGDVTTLANTILNDNEGDAVLVVGHSNTVALIANALGAGVPPEGIDDFDNLYVVSIAPSAVSASNLQYGAESTPDVTKDASAMTTLLLVQETGGSAQASDLDHTARKAGVSAIYAGGAQATVQTLAATLGLVVSPFDTSDIPSSIAQILANHTNEAVLISGDNDEIRAILQAVGGYPTPALFAGEGDNLFVVVVHASGEARVSNLRF